LAAQIKKGTGLEAKLESGKIGELSVYWKGEKLSQKGDPVQEIIEKIQHKNLSKT